MGCSPAGCGGVPVDQALDAVTCADDPDLSGQHHGAMFTLLILPDVKVLRSYRERAGCENRIKEHKSEIGLDSFVLNDFWATEAALRFGQARD